MIEILSGIVIQIITKFGYTAIAFLMFLESALIPVPSEVVMPFSGFVSLSGNLNFWFIVFFGTVSQLLGSIFIFTIGKKEGRHLLEKYGKYLLIRTKDIHHADKMFEKHGEAIVFFGRVIPIIRTFISLPAGISKMKFSKFVTYSLLGIIPWTLGLTWLGVKMGENWIKIKPYFHVLDILIVFTAVIILAWVIFNKNKKKTKSSN